MIFHLLLSTYKIIDVNDNKYKYKYIAIKI